MHIAIFDDQPQELEALRALVEAYAQRLPQVDFDIQGYVQGEALLSAAASRGPVDLYLLDILPAGLTGIDLGGRLRAMGQSGVIIYLTSSPDFALQAYGVGALQYLLKPIRADNLYPALDQALERLEEGRRRCLSLRTPSGQVALPFHAICYIESRGHILLAHLAGGQVVTSVNLRMGFEEALGPLLADERFLHPHKSFVVNMSFIRQMGARGFVLWDGASIPIARRNLATAKARYLAYLAGQS